MDSERSRMSMVYGQDFLLIFRFGNNRIAWLEVRVRVKLSPDMKSSGLLEVTICGSATVVSRRPELE